MPRQLGEPGERSPRERIDEQGDVEAAAHQLRRLHRPPQRVELAPIDGLCRPGARRRLATPARTCGRCAHLTDRVAHTIGLDLEPARELHDVLVAHEIVRMLGDQHRALLRGARPAFERRRVGRRAASRSRRNSRNGIAPFTARDELLRIVLPHVGRDRVRPEDRRPGTAPRSAAPTGSNARPRPGPRRRRRTRASPCARGSSA